MSSLLDMESRHNRLLEEKILLEEELIAKGKLEEDVQRLKDELRGRPAFDIIFAVERTLTVEVRRQIKRKRWRCSNSKPCMRRRTLHLLSSCHFQDPSSCLLSWKLRSRDHLDSPNHLRRQVLLLVATRPIHQLRRQIGYRRL
jgi:hypothetical protein